MQLLKSAPGRMYISVLRNKKETFTMLYSTQLIGESTGLIDGQLRAKIFAFACLSTCGAANSLHVLLASLGRIERLAISFPKVWYRIFRTYVNLSKLKKQGNLA